MCFVNVDRFLPRVLSLALTLALPLALVVNLSGCGKASSAATVPTPPVASRTVTVIEVTAKTVDGTLSASGDLIPLQEAAVVPEVLGYRVVEVLADVGDYVEKGQVLVRLDAALLKSQLAQQEALLAYADAQAEQAEDQARRVEDLDGLGVLSEEQIRQRRLQATAARQNARAQAAALREMRTRSAKLAVEAPVSGLVLKRTVRHGDLSASGGEAWFTLAKGGVIELEAQMSEEDLMQMEEGLPANVYLPNGSFVEGSVRLISPQIDVETKLGSVRIMLPVRDDVRAGGFARAIFTDVSGELPSLPETAIRYDVEGPSVMVVEADNRVKRYPVRTGRRGAGLVQLEEGPPPGTWVVRNAASFLLDGDRVEPVESQL